MEFGIKFYSKMVPGGIRLATSIWGEFQDSTFSSTLHLPPVSGYYLKLVFWQSPPVSGYYCLGVLCISPLPRGNTWSYPLDTTICKYHEVVVWVFVLSLLRIFWRVCLGVFLEYFWSHWVFDLWDYFWSTLGILEKWYLSHHNELSNIGYIGYIQPPEKHDPSF